MKQNNTSRNWMKRLWGALPFLVFLGLVGLILLMGMRIQSEKGRLAEENRRAMQQEKARVNVITLNMKEEVITEKIRLPGDVRPWVELDIPAEVRGTLVTKTIEEGTVVKKGDRLGQIDARDYRNALKSATASHVRAVADYERQRKLFDEQLTTRSRLDETRAQLDSVQAEMDNAQLALERTTIRSPMDGLVNRIFAEEGQYLNVGDRVAEAIRIDRVKVSVGIPESDVTAARHQESFPITIDALGGELFTGRKHFLSRKADTNARLYNLEVALDNAAGRLLPGMFARVEITRAYVAGGLAVPLYAIIKKNEKKIVFVEKEGLAVERQVTTGIQEGWRIEIVDGLAAGEQLIVVGHRNVNDGHPVTVVRRVDTAEAILQ